MFWAKKSSNNGNRRSDLEKRIQAENERIEKKNTAKVKEEPKVENNSHNKDVIEEELQVKPLAGGNGKKSKVYDEETEAPQGRQIYVPDDEDEKPDIPGKGFLYHAKDEHLGEATRLNEREILLFAVGDTQASILDPKRKTVYETFRNSLMRYKIALNGDGRVEAIKLKTMEAEKMADAAASGAMGGVKRF